HARVFKNLDEIRCESGFGWRPLRLQFIRKDASQVFALDELLFLARNKKGQCALGRNCRETAAVPRLGLNQAFVGERVQSGVDAAARHPGSGDDSAGTHGGAGTSQHEVDFGFGGGETEFFEGGEVFFFHMPYNSIIRMRISHRMYGQAKYYILGVAADPPPPRLRRDMCRG